jgi:UDP-2,3-diacylglucosamine pyrophosphatase LpxH
MVVGQFPRLSHFGHWAYNLALRVNAPINWIRRRLGLSYWSLSAWAKQKVKSASSIKVRFEQALAREARNVGVDGVICGHIHQADIHTRLGIEYLNSGDWVESCTAIAEHFDGEFELIRWPRELPKRVRKRRRRREARLA